MKCFHPTCAKRAPYDTLFRINAKGQPAVMACWEHRKNTDRAPDPELDDFVRMLEGSPKRRGNDQ